MKKLFIFTFFVIFLFSCANQPAQQKATTTVTSTEVTYSNQGFLVETQMVVKGNTVWGISQQTYGTGFMWRDIVSLNPFLNDPTRLYYNSGKGMWIVRIYPGETLKIRGQQVNPTYTYKETVTATTTEPASAAPVTGWWLWLIIAVIILLLILLISSSPFRSGIASAFSSSNSSTVNIENGSNVDLATCAYFAGRRQNLQDRSVKIIAKASKRDQLKSFAIVDGEFFAGASFKENCPPKNSKEEIEPKVEG